MALALLAAAGCSSSITGGNAANDASKAIVIHPTIVSDGQPHDFIYEKGSPGTNLAAGCVALNVDGGTEESACNSECSWAESDTLYFGGVPLSFNRFHQSADQSAALFNGGGATWQSNWDESWDDDAIISTYNFQGELTNLKYSFKLGQRDRAQSSRAPHSPTINPRASGRGRTQPPPPRRGTPRRSTPTSPLVARSPL